MAQYDGTIRIVTKITTKDAEGSLASLEWQIKKSAKYMDELRSKMDALKGKKIYTEEFKELEKQVAKADEELERLVNLKKEVGSGYGLNIGGEIVTIDDAIKRASSEFDSLYSKLNKLVSEGKDFTLGENTAEYASYARQLQYEEEAIAKVGKKYKELSEKTLEALERQAVAQRKIEAEAEKNLQKETARIQKEAEIEAKLKAEAAEEERLLQIRENAVVGNQRILEVIERRKQLLQEIADLEKAGVGIGYQQYDSAQQELAQLNQEIKDYGNDIGKVKENYKKLGDTAKKSFEKINKSTKKSGGLLGTMASRFKGLALSLLIFNQISKAFNAMTKAIGQGFENLYKDNEKFRSSVNSLKASSETLKNAFASAFRPLVEVAIPYIQRLMDYITKLLGLFGQFTALITGQKTYTKAIKQTAAATKEAAKEAKGYLSPLDEINQYSTQDNSGDDAGAGGTMFEEVPINQKLIDYFDKISAYAKKLKDIFNQGFWDGLGDWEYRWDSIKNSIASIKDSLIDIWTDPEVLASADKYVQSVAYMLGSLVGSLANIGLTIGANLLGGIAKYLEQNKDRIKGFLISIFDIWTDINNLLSSFFQSFAYVFEAFASENGQQLTANIIGIYADAAIGTIEILSKLARDILNVFIQPFVDNKESFRTALEGFLGVLATVAGTIKYAVDDTFDKLNEVYDEHFKPFFDSVAQGLSDLVGEFLTFWNGNVQPILDQMAADFDELWKTHIQPAINNFIELLGDCADLLMVVWENVLKPLVSWIIQNVLPVILPIISGIVKALFAAFGAIADIINGIIDAIRGIIQFLTGVFSGDWERAWNGITRVFDGIAGVIKGIVDGIIGVIMGIVDGVKDAISAINDLAGKKSSLKSGAGNRFLSSSFSASKFRSAPSTLYASPEFEAFRTTPIPKLATGAVIPANREFLAVLGDQKRGTNIEAPLDTIEQANERLLLKVLSRLGIDGNPGGGATYKFVAQLDGRTLFEETIKQGKIQQMSTGRDPFVFE
ncbi:hypothetical protein D5278_09495 [bacterium 1XD21-13]|nr:hypothetical protein [bacterium 1XD21-13]